MFNMKNNWRINVLKCASFPQGNVIIFSLMHFILADYMYFLAVEKFYTLNHSIFHDNCILTLLSHSISTKTPSEETWLIKSVMIVEIRLILKNLSTSPSIHYSTQDREIFDHDNLHLNHISFWFLCFSKNEISYFNCPIKHVSRRSKLVD